MKKIAIMLFVLFVTVCLNAQTFSNGNFESWTGNIPDGWTLTPDGADITFEKSDADAGRGGSGYALIIIANTNGDTDDGQMEATVTGIQAGQNYTLSIWTKQGPGDGNDIWVRFWDCRFYNSEDTQVGADYDEGSYSSGDNTDWLEYIGDLLIAPADAVKLRVNFRIYIQSGFTPGDYILVDDLSINGQTLPVELSTFTAQYLDSKPTLYWQTQSELDNMGWFIYRNTIEDFTSAEKISGMLPGHGTTTQPQSYIYEDTEQLQVEQTYYYWLESVDYSGTIHHYDRVAQITIPHTDDPGQNVTPPVAYDISADPNPFSYSTEITFAIDQISRIDVTIYNVKGQMVKSFGTVMTNADEEVSFQWNGKDNSGKSLSNGVYLYSVKVNGKDYATKQLILMK